MAVSDNYDIYSPDQLTTYDIPAELATMAGSIDDALLTLDTYMIGTRAQRTALTPPRLRKYVKFYETDYDSEWLYDGSAWVKIGGVADAWEALEEVVTWSSGFGESTGSPYGNFRARRRGLHVELEFATRAEADAFDVPVHGNISNAQICSGVPEKFRPGFLVAFSSAWHGKVSTFTLNSSGEIHITATTPHATAKGTASQNAANFTGSATYLAASY